MAIQESRYDIEQGRGDAEVPYLANPALTGSIRRFDPDLAHAYPYVPGLTDATISLKISRSPADVPFTLTHQFVLSGSPDSFKKAIDELNALGTDIQAIDAGGYLKIISQHPGFDNYIQVVASSGTDAAPLLGLAIDPMPGSISYAGELESTPPGPSQPNPQGTMLIGRDEDLISSSINRAIVGMQQVIDRIIREFDREVIGYKEYTGKIVHLGTIGGGMGTPVTYFELDDASSGLRVPLKPLAQAELALGRATADWISLLDADGKDVLISTGSTWASAGAKVLINRIYYGGTQFYYPDIFTSWGTPDGKSIHDPGDNSLYQKTKHPIVAIEEIHGNTLVCPLATFEDLLIQPGDTVFIQDATNSHPFSHNGEFVVERVLSNTQLQVRAKTQFEELVFSSSPKPTRLNDSGTPSTYGNLKIPIGYFLPLSNLRLATSVVLPVDSREYRLRVATSMRLREMLATNWARPISNNADSVSDLIYRHVSEFETDPVFLHNASKIKFTDLPLWASGSADPNDYIHAGRVQTALATIVSNLASVAGPFPAGLSGSDRIGCSPHSGSPRALLVGTVWDQLQALLGFYNNHVYQGTADRHRALDVDKDQTTGNWYDGTNINDGISPLPPSVQVSINAIVSQLAVCGPLATDQDGAKRLGFSKYTLSGYNLNQGSVRTAFQDLLTHVVNHINAATGAHAASAISAATPRTYFSGASVEAQLSDLDSKAAFQAKANTFTQKQTLNGVAGDTNAAMAFTGAISNRKLLWEISAGSGRKIRFYANSSNVLEITWNAAWDGSSQWAYDINMGACLFSIDYYNKLCFRMRTAGTGTWGDGAWTSTNYLALPNQDAYTWVASQIFSVLATFNAGVNVNGAPVTLTSPNNQTEQLSSVAAMSSRRLLWKARAGNYYVRMYASYDAYNGIRETGLEVTCNCYWDGTYWNKDAGTTAMMYAFYHDSIHFCRKDGGMVQWGDTAWDSYPIFATTSSFNFHSYSNIHTNAPVYTDGNDLQTGGGNVDAQGGWLYTSNYPSIDASLGTGVVTRRNIPKAWVIISCAGYVNIVDGHNIYGITLHTTSYGIDAISVYDYVTITFKNNMYSSYYSVYGTFGSDWSGQYPSIIPWDSGAPPGTGRWINQVRIMAVKPGVGTVYLGRPDGNLPPGGLYGYMYVMVV